MTVLKFTEVHHAFKLNGHKRSKEDLKIASYSFIKEGDDYQKAIGEFLLDWFDNNTTIALHTSGTTGKAKTIIVNKQAMVASAIATGNYFNLHERDTALLCLPTQFIAGKMMIVRALILGLELDVIPPTSTPLKKANKQYDFVALTPMQVEASLPDLHKANKIIIGGAKVNQELEKKLLPIDSEIYETFGMTETLTHIAARRIGTPNFTTLPGVTVSLDERECLRIEAPRIFKGFLITNDLITLYSKSEFSFNGRIDNVINSGGIKIFPETLEDSLQKHIPYPFFLGALPDETLGEKVVLVIEAAPYNLPENIFENFTNYQIPKATHFIASFLRTESGKIKRKETLQLIQNKSI